MQVMIVQAELTGDSKYDECSHGAKLDTHVVLTYDVPNWASSKGTGGSTKKSRTKHFARTNHFARIGEDLSNRLPGFRSDLGAAEMIADWLNRHWGGAACLTLSNEMMLVAFPEGVSHEKASKKTVTKSVFEMSDVLNNRKITTHNLESLELDESEEEDETPASKSAKRKPIRKPRKRKEPERPYPGGKQ